MWFRETLPTSTDLQVGELQLTLGIICFIFSREVIVDLSNRRDPISVICEDHQSLSYQIRTSHLYFPSIHLMATHHICFQLTTPYYLLAASP